MEIKFRVFRYNPEKDKKPYFDTFLIDTDPSERILDLLELVKDDYDSTLSFRRSCAHGVCGSDAMRINAKNALACKVLVKNLTSNTITVEPLLGLPVIRDLIVDMGPFFDHYKTIMPYLVNDDPLPADSKERLQTPAQQLRFEDATKCILCAACTTSCPSFWADGSYVGPAAIVNAHRFIFDNRDKASEKRLNILNQQIGVWRCRTAFNCTEACPREIKITQAIAEVKKVMNTGTVE